MHEHFNSNRKQAALFALAISLFCGSLQLQIERYRDNSTTSGEQVGECGYKTSQHFTYLLVLYGDQHYPIL
jgi:hypothetical protein